MEEIISIKNLNKTFKEVKAVNNLSFKVKKGEFFAFLGINGAGKSTTISIMCGELTRDSGEVYIDGKNIDEQMESIKVKMGVVYQKNVLDDPLTVKDNLKFRAALYGIHGKEFEEKYEKLASLLDFADLSSRTYGKLSGGQKRRVDIARALIHDPEILILDEPTTGLDPQTRKTVWKVVNDLRKEKGLTVFLTTHYMEEVTDADYVYVMDSGSVVMQGTPREIFSRVESLKAHRMDVPQITLLAHELKKAGLNLPDGILTRAELIEALTKIHSTLDK